MTGEHPLDRRGVVWGFIAVAPVVALTFIGSAPGTAHEPGIGRVDQGAEACEPTGGSLVVGIEKGTQMPWARRIPEAAFDELRSALGP